MRPEVVEAIRSISTKFVRLDELARCGGAADCEDAGRRGGDGSVGRSGRLDAGHGGSAYRGGSGPDPPHPDLTGMKTEVIVQKSHRFPYDHMVRNCGVRLIEVESREELERAINPNTAMLLFLNKASKIGKIGMEEFIAIGQEA